MNIKKFTAMMIFVIGSIFILSNLFADDLVVISDKDIKDFLFQNGLDVNDKWDNNVMTPDIDNDVLKNELAYYQIQKLKNNLKSLRTEIQDTFKNVEPIKDNPFSKIFFSSSKANQQNLISATISYFNYENFMERVKNGDNYILESPAIPLLYSPDKKQVTSFANIVQSKNENNSDEESELLRKELFENSENSDEQESDKCKSGDQFKKLLLNKSFDDLQKIVSKLNPSEKNKDSSKTEKFHPWIPISSEDFKVVIDPKIEAAVRLDMVKRAKKSIDIITYDQRSDNVVGLPLLKAIKEAANRGVKVRFLTSWTAHILKDPFDGAGKFLNDPPPKTPIEFHVIGGPSMLTSGWGALDGTHQKLFIVDNETTIISGRGQGEEYLHWVDTGFIFKGKLSEQATKSFQNLWDTLKREKFLVEKSGSGSGNDSSKEKKKSKEKEEEEVATPLKELQAALSLNKKQEEQISDFSKWLDQKPIDPKNSKEVYKGRLLHFNLLEQLSNLAANSKQRSPYSFSYSEREEQLIDPVVKEVSRKISKDKNKDLKFYSLIANLPLKLKNKLLKEAKKGKDISMFTNGDISHASVVPGALLSVGWYASKKDMREMIGAGIKIYGHTPDLQKQEPNYVHRKLAVTGNTVIFGSHNLSVPSSAITDEVSVEIVSPSLAKQVREIFDDNIKTTGKEITADQVQSRSGILGGSRQLIQDYIGNTLKSLY
ncbi:MAG: hypothetical protein HQK51_08935 [Oligoflexia bacterium]|nr:hypothetical protein [Oligoflexia bacterium]